MLVVSIFKGLGYRTIYLAKQKSHLIKFGVHLEVSEHKLGMSFTKNVISLGCLFFQKVVFSDQLLPSLLYVIESFLMGCGLLICRIREGLIVVQSIVFVMHTVKSKFVVDNFGFGLAVVVVDPRLFEVGEEHDIVLDLEVVKQRRKARCLIFEAWRQTFISHSFI